MKRSLILVLCALSVLMLAACDMFTTSKQETTTQAQVTTVAPATAAPTTTAPQTTEAPTTTAKAAECVAKGAGKSNLYGMIDIDASFELLDDNTGSYTFEISGAYAGDMAGKYTIPTTWKANADGSMTFVAYSTNLETNEVTNVDVNVYTNGNGAFYSELPAAVCGADTVMASREVKYDMVGTAAPYGAGVLDYYFRAVLLDGGVCFYTLGISGLYAGEMAGTYVIPTSWNTTDEVVSFSVYKTDPDTNESTIVNIAVNTTEDGVHYATIGSEIYGGEIVIADGELPVSNVLSSKTSASGSTLEINADGTFACNLWGMVPATGTWTNGDTGFNMVMDEGAMLSVSVTISMETYAYTVTFALGDTGSDSFEFQYTEWSTFVVAAE